MPAEQTSQNSGKWANKTSEFAKIKSLLNTSVQIYGFISQQNVDLAKRKSLNHLPAAFVVRPKEKKKAV